MNINATLVNIYHICQREMWLHAHAIRMEHTSDVVYEGKLIGEESYPQRAEKNQEVQISAEVDGATCTAKIDYYDSKHGIVHETKRSAAKERAHVAQVQFYLFLLRKNGVAASHGLIEYPKLRQTERVDLAEVDEQTVAGWVRDIVRILNQEQCPPRLPISRCRSCSYLDFCHVAEVE